MATAVTLYFLIPPNKAVPFGIFPFVSKSKSKSSDIKFFMKLKLGVVILVVVVESTRDF